MLIIYNINAFHFYFIYLFKNRLASVPGTITPVQNLINQKLISQPIFGVYLGKGKSLIKNKYFFFVPMMMIVY